MKPRKCFAITDPFSSGEFMNSEVRDAGSFNPATEMLLRNQSRLRVSPGLRRCTGGETDIEAILLVIIPGNGLILLIERKEENEVRSSIRSGRLD